MTGPDNTRHDSLYAIGEVTVFPAIPPTPSNTVITPDLGMSIRSVESTLTLYTVGYFRALGGTSATVPTGLRPCR